MPIIDQLPESRFVSLLKPFFDSIDPCLPSELGAGCGLAVEE
jgi:hypothetical protein